jgi:putative exosortase-associated protein (TIGR04073 family)
MKEFSDMLKPWKFLPLAVCLLMLSVAGASARGTSNVQPYEYREGTRIDKMGEKFGRGFVNILTFWVEIPHSMAIEWNRTDPVTGVFMGGAKGVTWGAARLLAGAYEVVTFPFPTPNDYQPIMHPEYIMTATWGNEFPEITDLYSNDPMYSRDQPTYPNRFRF